MIGADSLSLEGPGLTFEGDKEGVRVWRTDSGDGLGLWFFAIPPDLPSRLDQLDELRAFYRQRAVAGGMGIISVDGTTIDGCPAVKTIFKAPLSEPAAPGRLYVAAVTIPFRNFSFVLKTQCQEQGTTGMRDATVLALMQREGRARIEPPEIIGWDADPYDPSIRAGLLRNLSEDEQYDAMFPRHPLSRARRLLAQIEAGTRISDEAKSSPPFAAPAKRRFWPFRGR
jgi:hypothetical protein